MEASQRAKKTRAVDVGALLDACDAAVVTLVAGETRLVVHRAVLMDRSPVFSAMFAHDTHEASSNQVTIRDVEGPVLRQMVSYLYTMRKRQLPDMFVPAAGSSREVCGGQSQRADPRRKITIMEAIQHAKKTRNVNLGALLDACDDAVVTLVAGETRLVAHRAVLMDRSPVFGAMFRHDTLESRSGQVTIVDVEGPVLRQLVSYLYTLRAPQLPDIDMVSQLLVAADKYLVARLKKACGKQIAEQLSVETAAAAAVLAVRYSCETLRQASIAFLMNHTHQVMTSCGWKDAMRSQPDDLMEMNRLLIAEIRRLSHFEIHIRMLQAAEKGSVEELEVMLAAGVNVASGLWDGFSSLFLAARNGHVGAVRWLIAHRAPVICADRFMYTPLHWAALCGHVAVARLLLAASADLNFRGFRGETPLHCAAYKGHAEVAAALLEAGADRAAKNYDGETPLDLARKKNHQQLVELLTRT